MQNAEGGTLHASAAHGRSGGKSGVTAVRAPRPSNTCRAACVDILIVNRIRHCKTTYDVWGKPQRHFSETIFVSFWTWLPLWPPPMGLLTARGWWADCRLKSVTPASCGWCVVNDEGLTVFGGELLHVDSPFDYEVRNRLLYSPIQ